jgi:hypothetical protein
MRACEILVEGRRKRNIANPQATIKVLPLAVAPMCPGIIFANDRNIALLAVLFFGLFFIFAYKIGMTIARKRGSWRVF